MTEGKGLLLPNVESIQALLRVNHRNASTFAAQASALASRACIDLRTAETTLLGNRKQRALMEKIANAYKVTLNQIVKGKKKDDSAWPSYSGIQICKDWEPSWSAIEKAQESILIIDSFFANEHGRLHPALAKNAARRTKLLRVSVYMTSSEREFGAQRMRELDSSGKLKLNASFAERITQDEFRRYKEKFRGLTGPIRRSGDGLNAKVALFEYFCMPSIRIILVDEVHFFWSWFPLGAQNPGHVCLYLHDDGNLNAADRELSKWLRNHVTCVMRLSRKTKVQAQSKNSGQKVSARK